ncbi:MAG: anti-sigma factor antagonist [Anaerolineae bacterium]|nr:anti-sigma factor antagonist [Anaerolineae bacterium]
MQEIRQLTVLGRHGYDSIPTITHFAAEAARAALLDKDAIFHCQMAVDEACTNIIEHAYGEENVGEIEITCFIEPGTCTFQIIDHGKPFDPDSVPAPKMGVSLQDIRPGGIGLHLMRHLMDEVTFEFTSQGNKLTMKKSSSHQDEPTQSRNVQVHQKQQDIQVVQPHGRLDATTAPELEKALIDLLEQEKLWILVDMTHVTYISSRGLKTLVAAWRRAGSRGGRLTLCTIASQVLSIFETVGFTQIFDIYPSQDKALTTMATQKASKD